MAKISLRVRDAAASSAFYRRVFDCTERTSDSRYLRQLALPQNDSSSPAFIELREGRPLGAIPAIDHFSIEVMNEEAVKTIYERALREDVRVLPLRQRAGSHRCMIFDPDGYKIEVFARASFDAGDDDSAT